MWGRQSSYSRRSRSSSPVRRPARGPRPRPGARRPRRSRSGSAGAPASSPCSSPSSTNGTRRIRTSRSTWSARSNDDKIVAAIRGGNAPDVASSFNSYNVGTFCSSGAFDRPRPVPQEGRPQRLHVPAQPRSTTRSTTAIQCALPMLADVYGLYYNKTLFKQAGHHAPAEDDLGADRGREEADRARLERRDQGRRLRPVHRLLRERARALDHLVRRPVDGRERQVDRSPATRRWTKLLTWQKSLIDWYGYDKLVRFQAGVGDEFSASNAFENGKLAMNIDGEWRVAFIKAEHPELELRHGADAGRRRPARALRLGLHQRHDHRHPEEREAQGRGVGARQVPDDERPRPGRSSPTACATCRRRRASLTRPSSSRTRTSRRS